jgi:tetratricopeptide (TPR) repeat protein
MKTKVVEGLHFVMKPVRLFSAGVVFFSIINSGCTTSIKKPSAADTAQRARPYLKSVGLVQSPAARESSCVIPSGLDSRRSSHTHGSHDWRGLVERASACVRVEDWKALEKIAAAMARIDLDSPWGAYFLSLAAEGTGDFDRALWMVELALKKAGEDFGLFVYQRGRIFVKMNEIAKGLGEIERAVAGDRSLVAGSLYLATIYHRDAELERAEKNYRFVLDSDPRHYEALVGLAEVRLQLGDGAGAGDLYQRTITHYPHLLQPWVRLAYIYESIHKSPELALVTYKDMRSKIDSGALKERPDFDLNAKIRALETTQQRLPAEVSTMSSDSKRSVK